VALEVVVPPGASAEIHLSDGQVEQIGSGTHRFSWRHRVNAAPPVLAAAD
jgi:alpha-L-rhamnosidase